MDTPPGHEHWQSNVSVNELHCEQAQLETACCAVQRLLECIGSVAWCQRLRPVSGSCLASLLGV